MKRNLFYSFLAATSLLTLGACSNDELASETPDGGTSAVTFAVKAPTGMQSRAFADGTTATALSYAVYDETGKHLSTLDGTATMSSLKAEVSLNLVTGNTYKIVFFAQKAGTYTLDFDKATMTMPTTVNANDEGLDAFFKTEEIKVTGNSTQTVELRRPFAQLNIGTDDIKAAQSSGLAVAQTEVKVTGVPNVLNFLDGTVSGSQEVTYTAAAIPTGETFPVSGYEYLSMNYILMGTDKATTDVTLTIDGTKECTYASVPVQRNYRTNIYGSLLTSTAKFNVVIKPEFETPDYEVNVAKVTSAAEFADALTKGEDYIQLTNDISLTQESLSLSKGSSKIDLNGKTLTLGSTTNVLAKNGATITFTNGNITKESTKYTGAIVAQAGSSIVVEEANITYSGSGAALMAQGIDANITVKNSKVTNNGSGFGISTNASNSNQKVNITVENSTFIGMDPIFVNIPSNISIKDSNITGHYHALVVRGGTAIAENTTFIQDFNDAYPNPKPDKETYISLETKLTTWGTGNYLPLAAITGGNRGDSYAYPTSITLNGCTVKGNADFPAIITWGNATKESGGNYVTVAYDNATTFDGVQKYMNGNTTLNGEELSETKTIE